MGDIFDKISQAKNPETPSKGRDIFDKVAETSPAYGIPSGTSSSATDRPDYGKAVEPPPAHKPWEETPSILDMGYKNAQGQTVQRYLWENLIERPVAGFKSGLEKVQALGRTSPERLPADLLRAGVGVAEMGMSPFGVVNAPLEGLSEAVKKVSGGYIDANGMLRDVAEAGRALGERYGKDPLKAFVSPWLVDNSKPSTPLSEATGDVGETVAGILPFAVAGFGAKKMIDARLSPIELAERARIAVQEHPDLPLVNQSADTKPINVGEVYAKAQAAHDEMGKIYKTAYKAPDGRIFEGDNHGMAGEAAMKAGVQPDQLTSGFVNTEGKFYTIEDMNRIKEELANAKSDLQQERGDAAVKLRAASLKHLEDPSDANKAILDQAIERAKSTGLDVKQSEDGTHYTEEPVVGEAPTPAQTPTETFVPKNPQAQLFINNAERDFADAVKNNKPFDANKYFTAETQKLFEGDDAATERLQTFKRGVDTYNSKFNGTPAGQPTSETVNPVTATEAKPEAFPEKGTTVNVEGLPPMVSQGGGELIFNSPGKPEHGANITVGPGETIESAARKTFEKYKNATVNNNIPSDVSAIGELDVKAQELFEKDYSDLNMDERQIVIDDLARDKESTPTPEPTKSEEPTPPPPTPTPETGQPSGTPPPRTPERPPNYDEVAQKMFGKNFKELELPEIQQVLAAVGGDSGKINAILERLRRGSPEAGDILQSRIPGVTDLYEATRNFFTQDVGPFVKETGKWGLSVFDILRRSLAPRTLVGVKSLDNIMREFGNREKARFLVDKMTGGLRTMFDKIPDADKIDFIDRAKTGQAQRTPELQRIADLYRKMDDDLHEQVVRSQIRNMDEKMRRKWNGLTAAEQRQFFDRMKRGIEQPEDWMKEIDENTLNYLENHFRVLWKVVPGTAATSSEVRIGTRRPIAGTRGFVKQHTLTDISEGLERGGVPVSLNPQVLFERAYADATKFITANNLFADARERGEIEFFRSRKGVPKGWSTVDDPLFKRFFKVPQGMVRAGEWYMDDNIARLFRNYLSRDFIRETKAGSGLMNIKNATTAIELGFSPFHFIFENIESMSSNFALGMRELFVPGQRIQGVKDMLTTLFAPRDVSKYGSAAVKAYLTEAEFARENPKIYADLRKAYPNFSELIDYALTGGLKFGMHEDYKINTVRSFREALKNNNPLGAVIIRALPAGSQMMLKPLFEKYIPNLKFGTFMKEFNFELKERADDIAAGRVTKEQLAREVASFVENRFGEMNFDTLFWNRTMKSALQLVFRSVTWKLGNIRAFGEALPQQIAEINSAIKQGRAPRLTRNMSWLLGLSFTTATISSIVTKASTGKYPWELADDWKEQIKNLVYPRTSLTDETERVSVPTYLRDPVSLFHSPTGYIRSSMTGEIGRVIEAWDNRDFYGVNVYDPEDPVHKQAIDIVEHLFIPPISYSSFQQAGQRGEGLAKQLFSGTGFSKAPGWIANTPATLAMQDIIRARSGGATITQEKAELRDFKKEFAIKFRDNKLTAEDLKKAYQYQLIDSNNQLVPDFHKMLTMTSGQRMFEHLSFDEAVKVFNLMDENERKSYQELFVRKIERERERRAKFPVQQE